MDWNSIASQMNREKHQFEHPTPLYETTWADASLNYAKVEHAGLDYIPEMDYISQWQKDNFWAKKMPKKIAKDEPGKSLIDVFEPKLWQNNLQYGDKKLNIDDPSHMMDYRPGMKEMTPSMSEYLSLEQYNKFDIKDIYEQLDRSKYGDMRVLTDGKFIYQKKSLVTGFPKKFITSLLPRT